MLCQDREFPQPSWHQWHSASITYVLVHDLNHQLFSHRFLELLLMEHSLPQKRLVPELLNACSMETIRAFF